MSKMSKLPVVDEKIAKQVWALPNVIAKRNFLLEFIGENYNTTQQGILRLRLAKMKTAYQIDNLVTNMMLKTDGLGV